MIATLFTLALSQVPVTRTRWPQGYLDDMGELPLNSKILNPPPFRLDASVTAEQREKLASTLDVRVYKQLIDQLGAGDYYGMQLVELFELHDSNLFELKANPHYMDAVNYARFTLEKMFFYKKLNPKWQPKLKAYLDRTTTVRRFPDEPSSLYQAAIYASLWLNSDNGYPTRRTEAYRKKFKGVYFLDVTHFFSLVSAWGSKDVLKMEAELLTKYPKEPTPVYFKMRRLGLEQSPEAKKWAVKYLKMETRTSYPNRIKDAQNILKR